MHKDPRGYFYRSRRVGNRVTRQYIGRGARCEGMVRLETLQREEKAEERRAQREERDRMEALDGAVKTFCAQVTMVMRLVLQSHGYRQHARGQWRKQHMTQRMESGEDYLGPPHFDKVASDAVQSGKMEPHRVDLGKAKLDESVVSRLLLLLETVDTDEAARDEFFKILTEHGVTADVTRLQNCEAHLEKSLVEAFYPRDQVFYRENQERDLAAMRQELAGDHASPLERLLVSRIVICWLHLQLCEKKMTEQHDFMPLDVAAYQHKRLEQAHNRFMSAIKKLAEVRKLQLPTMQINIGQKQVNLAQGAPQVNGELT